MLLELRRFGKIGDLDQVLERNETKESCSRKRATEEFGGVEPPRRRGRRIAETVAGIEQRIGLRRRAGRSRQIERKVGRCPRNRG